MPVYEILVFPASDAFAADPVATLKPAGEFFAKTEGCTGVFGGTAEEAPTGYIVIIWETFEHHQALINSPGYPQIIGLAPVFGEGERKVFHVDFHESPDAAIAKATTEVLTMTLKENKTKDDLAAAVSALAPKITAEEGCTKPLAWGPTREESSKAFLFLGWVSSQRHIEVVAQESYTAPIQNLFAAVDIIMHHISFKKVL